MNSEPILKSGPIWKIGPLNAVSCEIRPTSKDTANNYIAKIFEDFKNNNNSFVPFELQIDIIKNIEYFSKSHNLQRYKPEEIISIVFRTILKLSEEKKDRSVSQVHFTFKTLTIVTLKQRSFFDYIDISKRDECIGSGSYGKVFKFTSWRGKDYALKIAQKRKTNIFSDKAKEYLLKECSVLEVLNKDYNEEGIQHKPEKCMCIEEANSSLIGYIGEYYPLNLNQTNLIFIDLVKGIRQILNANFYATCIKKIIHGDLKPSNICIDSEGNWRIIDWAGALIFDPQNRILEKNTIFSYKFVSYEESFIDVSNFEKIDKRNVLALGITIYKTITHLYPFPFKKIDEKKYSNINPPKKYSYKNCSFNFDPKPLEESGFSIEFIHWLANLMNPEVNKRYNAQEAWLGFLSINSIKN